MFADIGAEFGLKRFHAVFLRLVSMVSFSIMESVLVYKVFWSQDTVPGRNSPALWQYPELISGKRYIIQRLCRVFNQFVTE